MNNTEQIRTEERMCAHCGAQAIYARNDLGFCCGGCEHVYNILHSLHLEKFYSLRSVEDLQGANPVQEATDSFSYLDNPSFAEDYVKQLSGKRKIVDFYIEGIHCTACIWLLEQLPRIVPGIIRSELHFEEARLVVTFRDDMKISRIAETIESLGYKPQPLREDEYHKAFERESLQLLFRLGVAAVSAGNCMMIAISLYEGEFTGIEEKYSHFFIWVSALLALPAVLYSAQPFYQAALSGLRHRILHVDLPLSIGIIFGYLLSLASAAMGAATVYFDSITILIFLILGGRLLQRYSLRKTLDKKNNLDGILPLHVFQEKDGVVQRTYRGSLQKGDRVRVECDEVIPTDGILEAPRASVDMSILSGESEPIPFHRGERIYAASKNVGAAFVYTVTETEQHTRIARICQHTPLPKETTSHLNMIHLISRNFVVVVLTLSFACFTYWYLFAGLEEALQTTLAFIVVTCPCALGLSAPLLFAKAISDANKLGIMITDPEVFERFVRADGIFFDKTGTLTERNTKEIQLYQYADCIWQEIEKVSAHDLQMLSALEADTTHPVGRALKRLMNTAAEPKKLSWKKDERTGVLGETIDGKTGAVGNWNYVKQHCDSQIGRAEPLSSAGSIVYFCSEQVLYAFVFQECLQPGVKELFNYLRGLKKRITILSGDSSSAVHHLGKQCEIVQEDLYSEMSPEQKAEHIRAFKGMSVMIGDGANDAPALREADLGIGVSGGVEQVLRVAPVFIAREESIAGVYQFAKASAVVVSALRRSFIFALSYNILAGGSALLGLVSPLLAAILMPLSSITVITMAYCTHPFRQAGKGK